MLTDDECSRTVCDEKKKGTETKATSNSKLPTKGMATRQQAYWGSMRVLVADKRLDLNCINIATLLLITSYAHNRETDRQTDRQTRAQHTHTYTDSCLVEGRKVRGREKRASQRPRHPDTQTHTDIDIGRHRHRHTHRERGERDRETERNKKPWTLDGH